MKKLIIIVAALIISSSASAQREFAKVDSNNDGGISLVEFLHKVPETNVEKMAGFFVGRDKNKDGQLTKKEYTQKKKSKK
jgi:Ca2+-binding EF-hand superfamily protein